MRGRHCPLIAAAFALGPLRVVSQAIEPVTWTLDNGLVTAQISDFEGLQELREKGGSGVGLKFPETLFQLNINNEMLVQSSCRGPPAVAASTASMVSFNWTCSDFVVQASYTLRQGASFIEVKLAVTAPVGADAPVHFAGASIAPIWVSPSGMSGPPSWALRSNPFNDGLEIAGFARWPEAGRGAFFAIANPWGHVSAQTSGSDLLVSSGFNVTHIHDPVLQGPWLALEPWVIGFTTLKKYETQGVNVGEREAFTKCVESYLMDSEMRQGRSVKVNVAWDQNDYQIDVGTEEGKVEYRRIIDRNAQLGITHVIYEPQNTLHSQRSEATDDWGWEASLWLGMGEKLREGTWDPRTDDVPADILEMVQYAGSKGVKILAYAYPTLRFDKVKEFFTGSGSNSLSLAAPQVQTYFIEVMSAFLKKSGAAGFSWDHDIFAGSEDLRYSQWRGWMNILNTLRSQFPDMVMDHRQTNHAWGPWYQLAGSYAEPIAGDENPESYGIFLPSFHTDHVAADNLRRINYIYSTQQLLPNSRMPGFIFHQTERTDDDGTYYCTAHESRCVNNSNTRDFDYLGYKYSLLSSIGTAGLNNVVTMIPARDPAEFELLPAEDVAFIRDWLAWTDAHAGELANTQWLPTLQGPGTGVDGTHAMLEDEGFVFLFNPSMQEKTVSLIVDQAIGISDASSGASWQVSELFPLSSASVAIWSHGEDVSVTVGGGEARVLQLTKRKGDNVRLLHASPLRSARVHVETTGLSLSGAVGPAGQEVHATVRSDADNLAWASGVTVNGVRCVMPGDASAGPSGLSSSSSSTSSFSSPPHDLELRVRFGGAPVRKLMPVGPAPPAGFAGGWFNATFTISQAMLDQLSDRARKYPVPWTSSASGCGQPHCVDDSKATWLVPTRLLLILGLSKPSDKTDVQFYLDDALTPLQKAYNSRGLANSGVFLGFFYDASKVSTGVSHSVSLHLPSLEPDQFQGLFWENLETQHTTAVEACVATMSGHLVAGVSDIAPTFVV